MKRGRWCSVFPLLLCGALSACTGDSTITRGADGAHEWDRRIQAAVPSGTSIQDARALMERNGFTCNDFSATKLTMFCEKKAGRPGSPVERRWQATFEVKEGRVVGLQSSTELLRP